MVRFEAAHACYDMPLACAALSPRQDESLSGPEQKSWHALHSADFQAPADMQLRNGWQRLIDCLHLGVFEGLPCQHAGGAPQLDTLPTLV